MNDQFFNSDKEMRSLYLNRGMNPIWPEQEEEKKADPYAGLNKKQRQWMKLYEKMNKGKQGKSHKKMVLIQPD